MHMPKPETAPDPQRHLRTFHWPPSSGGMCRPARRALIPLPANCPELNPQENVWQFLRDDWLSNRIFKSYNDVVDHCCEAWNKLVDQPRRIMSIGLRNWAHGFRSTSLGITPQFI